MAVNNAGVGEGFQYTASTGSLPPPPPSPVVTTTENDMSTEVTVGYLSQPMEDNSVLSPAVFGGIITGAVLIVMVIILVTCLCIRRRRDQPKYVNSKNVDMFGNIQGEESLRTSKSAEERGSLRRIDFVGDTVQYGSNKTEQDVEPNKMSSLEVPRTKLLSKSNSSSLNGIENPGYNQNNDTESMSVSMTLSSEDLFSQNTHSLKRTSRMRSESAAAIAVMRNQRMPRLPRSMDDTDTLISHDSVVIYNERTAL